MHLHKISTPLPRSDMCLIHLSYDILHTACYAAWHLSPLILLDLNPGCTKTLKVGQDLSKSPETYIAATQCVALTNTLQLSLSRTST